MKKRLSDYCVRVTNVRQYNTAVKFFQLASHRPLNCYTKIFFPRNYMGVNEVMYVGMSGLNDTNTDYVGPKPCVAAGYNSYDTETIIPFENLSLLVDTKNRHDAYVKAKLFI